MTLWFNHFTITAFHIWIVDKSFDLVVYFLIFKWKLNFSFRPRLLSWLIQQWIVHEFKNVVDLQHVDPVPISVRPDILGYTFFFVFFVVVSNSCNDKFKWTPNIDTLHSGRHARRLRWTRLKTNKTDRQTLLHLFISFILFLFTRFHLSHLKINSHILIILSLGSLSLFLSDQKRCNYYSLFKFICVGHLRLLQRPWSSDLW
jgi:hypothetical protein